MNYSDKNMNKLDPKELDLNESNSLDVTDLNTVFLFENSRDAIGVSLNGIQELVNPMFLEMFGYDDPNELIGTSVLKYIAPSEHFKIKQNIEARAKGEFVPLYYESVGVKKDGTEFNIDFEISIIHKNGKNYTYSLIRDISESKQNKDTLSNIAVRFSSITGVEYFNKVCEYLTITLDMNYAFIGDIQNNTTVKVISGFSNGKVLEPFSYELQDTPCSNVEAKGFCYYSNGVQALFPKDQLLVDMEIEGYLGISLFDNEANSIGIIVLLSTKPILNESIASSTLQIFADRVTAEFLRIKAEETLKESEENLRNAQIISGIGHYNLDIKSGVWTGSAGINKIFGIDDKYVKDIAGFLNFLTPDNKDRILDYLQNHVIKNKNRFDLEYKVIHYTTKEEKWVHGLGQLKIDNDGNAIEMFGTIQDITKRKEAEIGLNLLSSAIEQSPTSVFITDTIGNFEYVNNKFCELTGYSKQEIYGKNTRILNSGFTKVGEFKNLWDTINSGNKWQGNLQNKKKNGNLYWEKIVISPILDENNNIIQFISLSEDITEKRKSEEEKIELERQLRHNQKLETIGTLAGGIAHDFNNMLTPIIGYSDLGKTMLNPEDKMYRYFDNILKASSRAKGLVEQILLFSKQKEKDKQPLALHLVINEALTLLRQSIPTTVIFEKVINPYCNLIMADSTQMHQVIINLCTNAWQSMEETGGTLTVKMEQMELNNSLKKSNSKLSEPEYICLTVSDTGCGISDDLIGHIFEPFYSTKSVDKGTGLGLSVVYGIIQNHNGEIIVESKIDIGTTFKVYLPTISEKIEQPVPNKDEELSGDESIIIIDDDQVVADMTKEILENYGYNATVFYEAQDVINEISKNFYNYDLLISDMSMPNMTGTELAEQIQKLKPGMPVIIMTGYNNKLLFEAPLDKLNIKSIVQKPVTGKELSTIIKHVLKK